MIGETILEELIKICEAQNVSKIYLEVRKSNLPAIGLYEKLGFKRLFTRKNFYHNPSEDDEIMELKLNPES